MYEEETRGCHVALEAQISTTDLLCQKMNNGFITFYRRYLPLKIIEFLSLDWVNQSLKYRLRC